LPSDISEQELLEEFSKHGAVNSVAIRSSNYDTFAFVQMRTVVEAAVAIGALNRTTMWGAQHLNVRIAHDPSNSISTPRLVSPPQPEHVVFGQRGGSCANLQDDDPNSLYANSRTSRSRVTDLCSSRCNASRVDLNDPYDLWRDCRPGLLEKARKESLERLDSRSAERCLTTGPPRDDLWSRSECASSRKRASAYETRRRMRSRSSRRSWSWRSRSQPDKIRSHEARRAERLCIVVHNLPLDMSRLELKNLGRIYGFVANAYVLREAGLCFGVLEFCQLEDLERARSLEGQRIEGSRFPLRCEVVSR